MRFARLEVFILPLALTGIGYTLGRLTCAGAPAPHSVPPQAAAGAKARPVRPRWTIALAAVLVILGGAAGSYFAVASQAQAERLGRAMTGGDPTRAPALLRRYGCGGCHTISALGGADGKVAVPLDGLAQRVFIGGVARNSPGDLVRWIVSPQSLSPRSAMPATGITSDEARDVAAFLYAH